MASNTVYHPRFPKVTVTVADDAAREAHKAAGWRMTPIPADKGGELPKGTTKVANNTGEAERLVKADDA